LQIRNFEDEVPIVVLVTAFPCWFSPQLGFNIRGGKASQLGIFISKVIPDSDAHRAGLQEGDQVLSVNDVDFQDIEHSKAVEILKTAREITMRVRYFPYSTCPVLGGSLGSKCHQSLPIPAHFSSLRSLIVDLGAGTTSG
uniref:PDZ domain-containing protein n=1 Tax=Zonotrichia albicollis TaxID=44394 RepID=A0A8D2N3A0_ZONAL